MKKRIYLIFAIFVVFTSGITFAQESAKPSIVGRIFSEKKRNPKLEASIISNLEIKKENDKTTRYYFNYVDLNNDSVSEVLVYIFWGYFCGTGGCDAYLFKQIKNKFVLVTHFGPVRNPIVVSEKYTKGWKSLIFFNSGGGINSGFYSVCRFNGSGYPDNPTVEDEAPALRTKEKGIAYLEGIGAGNSGLKFRFK